MGRAKLKDTSLRLLGKILKRYFRKKIPFEKVRNFLFIYYYPALGSTLSVTPIFQVMRKRFPGGRTAVVCGEMGYQVFKYNPNIDEIYFSPCPDKNLLKAIFFFLKLRKKQSRYDCVITAECRFRVFFLAFLTGIKYRIGFENSHNFFCNATIPRSPHVSIIENNLTLLTTFDELPASIDCEPEIYFSQGEILFVEKFFKRKNLDRNKLIIAIQTQSKDEKSNRWYDERFARLADKIVKEFDANLIFTGIKSEILSIERIRAKMIHPSLSIAGETDIPQLAALLSMCDLLVTLDTGTMHVGRAVGVPMVIIGCAYQPRHLWLPIGIDKHIILIKDSLPCARCFKKSCSSRECMRQITTQEVFQAAKFQINRFVRGKSKMQQRLVK